jgi:hypothetical protein
MANGCPTLGCGGDPRYAAPGRAHIPGCKYPFDVKGSDEIPEELRPSKTLKGADICNYCWSDLNVATHKSTCDRPRGQV